MQTNISHKNIGISLSDFGRDTRNNIIPRANAAEKTSSGNDNMKKFRNPTVEKSA